MTLALACCVLGGARPCAPLHPSFCNAKIHNLVMPMRVHWDMHSIRARLLNVLFEPGCHGRKKERRCWFIGVLLAVESRSRSEVNVGWRLFGTTKSNETSINARIARRCQFARARIAKLQIPAFQRLGFRCAPGRLPSTRATPEGQSQISNSASSSADVQT